MLIKIKPTFMLMLPLSIIIAGCIAASSASSFDINSILNAYPNIAPSESLPQKDGI